MYDPNQVQQVPYGQGQTPPAVPPVPSFSPQQPRKRRRWPWVVLGIVVFLLLACGGGALVVINLISHNPATDVVNHYYTAVKSQDYTTAFGYLDTTMKLTAQDGTSQQITQDLFTQLGQDVDSTKGQVSNYTITSTALNSDNGVSTATFTVSVTRKGASYDVHLQLQQEGNDWKLVSFDTL